MSEDATCKPAAPPARRWNYRSCDGSQCRWIHDLLPNERCWNCHKLPFAPSDEPDVIGSESGDVTVIHVHLRESLAEAERRLAKAEEAARHWELSCEASRAAVKGQEKRIATLESALANVRLQASMQAQEARTERSIILGILRELGLPSHDWEAEKLIAGKFATLTRQLGTIKEIATTASVEIEQSGFPRTAGRDSLRAILAAIDAPSPATCDPIFVEQSRRGNEGGGS